MPSELATYLLLGNALLNGLVAGAERLAARPDTPEAERAALEALKGRLAALDQAVMGYTPLPLRGTPGNPDPA